MCDVKSWSHPKYTAIKYGPDHSPRFTASVFINDAAFNSPTSCKSMKEAQNKAAEVALMHFISLSSARLVNTSSSPGCECDTPKDGLKMKETSKSKTIIPVEIREAVTKKLPKLKEKQEEHKNSNSIANSEEIEIEDAKLNLTSLSLEEYPQDFGPKLAQGGGASKSKKIGWTDPTGVDDSSLKGEGKLVNTSAEKLVDSKKQKDPEARSFLICNRVRVYTYIPDVSNLPKGSTVLQLSESKWVVVSLDFPNEKSK
ncbi:hypothetical protein BVRB_7g171600 [Beta vulgaris subsp. vulgaris]|nr:hypothetical protein BVRB_7g171600 [Beta vulgaris subsp. vulgaris]